MSATEYVVAWNGDKTGPFRGHLCVAAETPRPAPGLVVTRQPLRDRILDALRRQPMTLGELAAALQGPPRGIHGALWTLRAQGAVLVVDRRLNLHPGKYHRRRSNVYGLTGAR